MKLASCCLLLSLGLAGSGQTTCGHTEKEESKKAEDFVFEIHPQEIAPGEAAMLRWSIKGATRVVVQEAPDSRPAALRAIGEFAGASGKLEVKPKESTTYVIICDSATYVCASTSVRVRVKRH